IEIDLYDLDGDLVGQDGCPAEGRCEALSAGSGWSFFQQLHTSLGAGYRGSGYVMVDQPFTGLIARDVLRSDGTFQIAGDSMRLGSSTARHAAPIVQNTNDFVSRISVENTSASRAACIEIAYYGEGSLTPVAVDPRQPSAGCEGGG